MTHLTDDELVDFAESGVLPDQRLSHLNACASCRSRANDLRAALDAAASVDVPEPSPLFWDRLSARVRDEIAAEPVPGGWRTLRPAWHPRTWALTAAAILVAAVSIWQAVPRDRAVDPTATANVPPATARGADATAPARTAESDLADLSDPPDAADDDAWALVASVADDLDLDAAHEAGLAARPGSAERVALTLNDAELAEFVRLLEHELKRDKGA
jgi:hypothetical protein